MRAIIGCWRARCNALRRMIAAALLFALTADTGARLARLQLAAIPDIDPIPEITRLREAGRFGESLLLADAALLRDPPSERAARLRSEREATIAAQSAWLTRLRDVGIGAVTGGAGVEPGNMSLEMLLGAVATDMLVVGDVRDLIIQGARLIRDGEADPVIVALSGVGLATTLAPAADWAPALLKAARRAGALSTELVEFILGAARSGRTAALTNMVDDVARIATGSSPGVAARLIRLARSPGDLARMGRFIDREGKVAAAALHTTADAGVLALRSADELRLAGKADEALALEKLILKAGAKGEQGRAWLRAGGYRALLRPHPIVGAIKSVYKGHAIALVQRALERLDVAAWWLVPLLAAWTLVECGLLLRRLTRASPVRGTIQRPSAAISTHPRTTR